MKVYRRGCLKGLPYVRCGILCCKCELNAYDCNPCTQWAGLPARR